jgi:ribosome-binding ATPase YchF (GTP1/OBG family)
MAVVEWVLDEKAIRDFVKDTDLTENEEAYLRELNLLTAKPILYFFNNSEGVSRKEAEQKLQEFGLEKLPHVILSAKLELDLNELSLEERKELEAPDPELEVLIRACYELLGLVTFLTTGPDETRAWTAKKGTVAPKAAGVIHTDFERQFIRAKVVAYADLIKLGSFHEAQESGKLRVEGKDYIIKEGDIVEFVI